MIKKIVLGILLAIFLIQIPLIGAESEDNNVEMVPVIIVFSSDDVGPEFLLEYGFELGDEYSIIPGVSGLLPKKAIKTLEKNQLIESIEEDGEVSITAQTTPWGVDRIDADIAWSSSTGAGVKVAVLDTGIYYDHPDLADNVAGGVAFVKAIGRHTYDWYDDNGHGTHVAGTVAAIDNTIGVVGVAPEASLYGVKVLDRKGSGTWANVISGIDWARTNNMDIISMSLSGGHYSAVETACNNAWDAGLIIVAAAGNDGTAVAYPAAYSSVIAVSATDQYDGYPSWSNYGSQIELSAPGVSVYSTAKGGGYTTFDGTSMSTPHVSGVAALVLADDPSLTNSEVRTILQDSAEDLGPTGRDENYGYGLVDAEAAVGSDETPPVITIGPTVSSITDTTATVTWTTDESSDSTVEYGLDTNYGSTETDSSYVTSHSITLTNLNPSTTYYYRVGSVDPSNNGPTWSSDDTFTTSEPDTTAPSIISGPTVSSLTGTTATITWTTDEPSDSTVEYGLGTNYGSTETDSSFVTSHSITLTNLNPSTTYHYRVGSVDPKNNGPTWSSDDTFTTLSPQSMHVSNIDMWYKKAGPNYFVHTVITIVDDTNAPVAEAIVYIDLVLPGSGTEAYSGATDTNGIIDLGDKYQSTGTYTSTVTNVIKSGWTYDSGSNVETSDSLVI